MLNVCDICGNIVIMKVAFGQLEAAHAACGWCHTRLDLPIAKSGGCLHCWVKAGHPGWVDELGDDVRGSHVSVRWRYMVHKHCCFITSSFAFYHLIPWMLSLWAHTRMPEMKILHGQVPKSEC